MAYERQYSLHVSRALDLLGKSKEIIKFRIEQYKVKERAMGCNNKYKEIIMAGSKGEGLTAAFESDRDMMFVFNDVICIDNTVPFRDMNGVTVFEAERRNTPPGYTLLRLLNGGGLFYRDHIQQALFNSVVEQPYLPSDLFFGYLQKKYIDRSGDTNFYRSGPAHSISISDKGFFDCDIVNAFPYCCPEIIQSFLTRPRDHDWPTNHQLTDISRLEGHVVPIGFKGSSTAFLEWRICYTKAERYLVRSLNETQTKTYILLKMVKQTYISSVCKEITSYVLKNIVLWLAESFNIETFKEELLVDRLIQALVFLRICVINNNLPSYMIPERNLFSGKLDICQRNKLAVILSKLIHEGGSLLIRCENLGGNMILLYKVPALAEQNIYIKDVIEKMWLQMENIKMYGGSRGNRASGVSQEEMFNRIERILRDTLEQDVESLMLQGHDYWSILNILLRRLYYLSVCGFKPKRAAILKLRLMFQELNASL